MTDQTPSPQSVVPVGPKRVLVLKSAVERLILAADMYGVAHLDSDDMDDDAVELQDATEGMKDALAAAPTPLSLAGGEVTDEWADRFCEAVNWSPDGQECKTVEGELRCTTFRQIAKGHILSAIATNPYPDNAALSPEAPAREVCDLEGLLTTALTDELQDGGAEVPYSIIAERVAARVADEASAPSCALTAAAEEALSFLQNAPLESGICCCGDPISGHGYGSGHSPVDDLAYHSSQVAEKLQAALTPRHEAPASDGEREPLCMAYKTGYAEGVEDSNGMFDRDSCEEGWGQYAEKLSAQPALPARLPLPTVDDGRGASRHQLLERPMTPDHSALIERLEANEPLPICPYDRRSPEYWTTNDTDPCKLCGTKNEEGAPDLCRGADTRLFAEAAAALRARSSAPEAREGYPSGSWGCVARLSDNTPWEAFAATEDQPDPAGAWSEIIPLYTHPAAPSADKLGIAVEALEKIKKEANEPRKFWSLRILETATKALAALQAEQGAK